MNSADPQKCRCWQFLLASSLGLAICFLLASTRLKGLLLNSALLTGGTLLVSLPLGVGLAVALTKTTLPGRRFVERLMIAMLFVPLYVQAAAWQATLGQGGWLLPETEPGTPPLLHGWLGAIWVHAMAAVPWVVLFVGAALRNVPRELEEESLQDASSLHVLWRVSLQRALAGVFAAALWIAVLCSGEIAVTDLFQVRTYAEEIYTAASLGMLGDASSQSFGMLTGRSPELPHLVLSDLWLGVAALGFAMCALLAVTWSWLPATAFFSIDTSWKWQPGRARWGIGIFVWLAVAVTIFLPLVSLVSKAGIQAVREDQTFTRTWSAAKAVRLVVASPWDHRREWMESFTIGTLAALSATAVALLIAWGIRRGKLPRLPVAVLLALGFAIPGPLLGVWLIQLLNQPADSVLAWLSWWYDHSILAPWAAQFFRTLPLVTLLIGIQLSSLSQEVVDSAESEGAGWGRQLLWIVIPLYWPGLIAAVCMALVVAVGELAATLLVVPPGVSTLSIRIFGLLHYGAEDQVSALSLMLALAVGSVAAAAWHFLQRSGKTID